MTKPYTENHSSNKGHQVSGDNPEAYIARDRRHALATGSDIPGRVYGSAIFADISGFTPLTEALCDEFGAQRGAEELTRHLDRIFHEVISELDCYGGNVIYFAGDAITCWLDGDDGQRAIACALAMQDAIARRGSVVTGNGLEIRMALKVAITVGEARRAVVGDPDIQYIDVLAGQLLDNLAAAEQNAQKGEVLLDESVLTSIADQLIVSDYRTDAQSGRKLAVVTALNKDVAHTVAKEAAALDDDIIRQWLLPSVYDRLTTGRGEFIAELRPAYPVFIRFSGIDFDAEKAIEYLNDFVIRAQRIFDNYGGNVLQLTLGDKGAYLYGVFGSPLAHEDDAARAASAALELVKLDVATATRDIQIGIAYGSLLSGTYGHQMRRTFVCLGDAVNLAARLMSAAPASTIYVADEVRQAAGDTFIWEQLEPLRLKGKDKPVSASQLSSSLVNISRRKTRYDLPIVGRKNELKILRQALDDVIASQERVVGITAEAGLGKSRLIAEFLREVRRSGIFVAFGECQSFGVNSSYFVWREIFYRLLGINADDDTEQQIAAIEAFLKNIDPALVARSPLLAEVLSVSIADSELTATFDAKLRKSSLEDLLSICLKYRSQHEPIVIVLEDSHWIDALSRELLESLIRATTSCSVLVLLAYRPATNAATGGDSGLEKLPQFSEVTLNYLQAEAMQSLIKSKSKQLFAMSTPADELLELIINRSQGNPFYAEELLNYIASQGVKVTDVAALQALELPDSLHNLVLSRIDLLAEYPRRTLKVASVIGRLFNAPTLMGVYPDLGNMERILAVLNELQSSDLISVDQAETLSYLFQHVVTHEVSYNSLPFSVRATLHRQVAEFIERSEAKDLEPQLDLLAHHFWNGDDEAKKCEYLIRAEESARRRYANAAAIDYGKRLTTLMQGAELGDVLLRLGKVYELTGAWSHAEEVEQQAYQIAKQLDDQALKARCEVALAEVGRKQGRYKEAVKCLDRAADRYRKLGDDEGLGVTLHVSGTVAAQQGDYTAARSAYQSSLEIRQRLDDRSAVASLYSNLAIIAEYRGDYDQAHADNEQALAIRREIGDLWSIGVSQNNIGMIAFHQNDYRQARKRFNETLRLNREVGDPWMVAVAENNLGNATRELGDDVAALKHYAASLEAYRIYDDHWALAFLLEDIAVLAALLDKGVSAFELLGAADAMREKIGSPRNPALEKELGQRLSAALNKLGMMEAEKAQGRGKKLSIASAISSGLYFCMSEHNVLQH